MTRMIATGDSDDFVSRAVERRQFAFVYGARF